MLLSLAWCAAVALLIWRAARQGRAFQRLEPLPSSPDGEAARVAVIVPARNEAGNIGPCLATLMAQTFPAGATQIVVVDDASDDDTAGIVATVASRCARVRLERSPPLPSGWIGKTHACQVGAARADDGVEWFCFLDADVRAQPALLATALAFAERHALDFLSLTPRQDLVSIAERLVMPCGFYLLAFRQDIAAMQAPTGTDATATGQFILVRRRIYDALGGHAAVRDVISEDVALARLAKRAGHRTTLAGGEDLLRTRMYTGWDTLWLGVSKNLVDMLGGARATVLVAVAGVVLSWAAIVLPALDAIRCFGPRRDACAALAFASAGSATAFAFHVAGSVFFRIPFWYGLLFPAGYTAGALMALDSVRRRATGRTSWKGRIYP